MKSEIKKKGTTEHYGSTKNHKIITNNYKANNMEKKLEGLIPINVHSPKTEPGINRRK